MEISYLIIDDEPHTIAEFTSLIDIIPGIYVLNNFENEKNAITYLSEKQPIDVIFSDIEIPTSDDAF